MSTHAHDRDADEQHPTAGHHEHADDTPKPKPRAPRKAAAKKAARKRAPVKRAAAVDAAPVTPLVPDVPVIPAGGLLGNAATPTITDKPAAAVAESFKPLYLQFPEMSLGPVSGRLSSGIKREEDKVKSFAQTHAALGWWIAAAALAVLVVIGASWAGMRLEQHRHASAAPSPATPSTFVTHADTLTMPAVTVTCSECVQKSDPIITKIIRRQAAKPSRASAPVADAPLPTPARVSVDLAVRAPAAPALPDAGRGLFSATRPDVFARQWFDVYPTPPTPKVQPVE